MKTCFDNGKWNDSSRELHRSFDGIVVQLHQLDRFVVWVRLIPGKALPLHLVEQVAGLAVLVIQ